MPEGPEVRIQVDRLQRYKNKSIESIKINGGRYSKKEFLNYKRMRLELPLKIKEINCKGKFIYWIFDNGGVLFNTLGMSGVWLNENDKMNYLKDFSKHNNIRLVIDNKELYFNDYRNFGTLMYRDREDLDIKLEKLGVDILMEYDLYKKFRERINRKRNDGLIGNVLLDQKVVAGCGNYLRAEVLYHSKISPFRKLKDIKEEEYKLIWRNLTKIGWIFYNIEKGIKRGVISENEKIVRMYNMDRIFYVYMEDRDLSGNKVIRERLGTRMIHWIPKIQK